MEWLGVGSSQHGQGDCQRHQHHAQRHHHAHDQLILQLLDPNNAENVLMDMRADGNVGFRQLFADQVVSKSVVSAYTGSPYLYVNPSLTGTVSFFYKSIREACESLNGKYIQGTVTIHFANTNTETVYENAGILLQGISGPGRVWIGGKSGKSIVGYISIDNCAISVFLDSLAIRESRPLSSSNRNKAVIYAHHCSHAAVQHCTINGNNTTDAGFQADYTNSAMWNCAIQNVNTGYYVNSNMGVMDTCTGALTNAMWSNSGIIFCVNTVPNGTRAKYRQVAWTRQTHEGTTRSFLKNPYHFGLCWEHFALSCFQDMVAEIYVPTICPSVKRKIK